MTIEELQRLARDTPEQKPERAPASPGGTFPAWAKFFGDGRPVCLCCDGPAPRDGRHLCKACEEAGLCH